MRNSKFLLALPLLLLPAAQSGCLIAAAAVGTGATVAYVRGDLETTLDASPNQVADASVAAAKDLSLVVVSHDIDGLGGKVVTRTADDTRIVIAIEGQSDKLSKVTIRVGTFGDNAIQQRVMDKIKSELSQAAARSVSTTAPTASTSGNVE
jgi:hypothetical protein